MNNHIETARLCVELGAHVNQKNDSGMSSIYCAAQDGHNEVVEFLIQSHADVNQEETTNGTTPVYMAAYNGHADTVLTLVNIGKADINKKETYKGANPVR